MDERSKEAVIIETLRDRKDRAVAYEREAAGLRSQAKGLEKQAKAIRDEMDQILTAANPAQLDAFEPPTSWSCANCGETFSENPGETHTAAEDDEDGTRHEYDCGPVRPVAKASAAPPATDEDEETEDDETEEDEEVPAGASTTT